MTIVTYEEKMDYMDNLIMRSKLLHETCASCISEHDLEILECIKEDVDQMHQLGEQCKKRQEKEVADIYEEMFLK